MSKIGILSIYKGFAYKIAIFGGKCTFMVIFRPKNSSKELFWADPYLYLVIFSTFLIKEAQNDQVKVYFLGCRDYTLNMLKSVRQTKYL